MSQQIDTVSHHSRWPLVANAVSNSALAQTFQVRPNIPPNPTVRIIFHGLLSFFFDGNRKCQVGIPNITQGLPQPHRHPHEFDVSVWAIADRCSPVPWSIPIENSKLIEKVDITVSNPKELDGVYVYEKDPNVPFNRLDPQGTNDPQDWRWVLDVEGDLHPTGVSEIPETLKPSVYINNGLFYTYYKTKSTYRLHPNSGSGGDIQIGTYGEILACNIYLGLGSSVTISIPPFPLPITLAGGIGLKYQIDITNNCRKEGKVCKFEQSGPKENRNDFYLYYQTFNRPSGDPEYELQLEHEVEDQPVFDICQAKSEEKRNFRSSKAAPCGGIVHSQTSAV